MKNGRSELSIQRGLHHSFFLSQSMGFLFQLAVINLVQLSLWHSFKDRESQAHCRGCGGKRVAEFLSLPSERLGLMVIQNRGMPPRTIGPPLSGRICGFFGKETPLSIACQHQDSCL
jgi:hypothetical protein